MSRLGVILGLAALATFAPPRVVAQTPTMRVVAASTLATSARSDDQTLVLGLDSLAPNRAFVGAGVEARRRAFAGGASEVDVLLTAQAGHPVGADSAVSSGVALGPGAAVAPRAQVWAEVWARLAPALEGTLRAWWLHFAATDVVVLVPGVQVTLSAWTLGLSDYLALHDDGSLTHSAVARAEYALGPMWSVGAMGAFGTGADFVGSPQPDVGQHWAVGGQLRGQLDDWTSTRLGYQRRAEQVGPASVARHELSLVWMRAF